MRGVKAVMNKGVMGLILLMLLPSCYRPWSPAYRHFYQHLSSSIPRKEMHETPYFLIILVDARHLDYTDNQSFFNTVAKHPDGSKSRDIGHAWIYLRGVVEGKEVIIEGGHSGERGRIQARYFDGIMNYNDWGYANPTEEEMCHPRYEPNPVKYLWTTQEDGFFQKGSGGHIPTFAAKIDLTEQQFQDIVKFIHPRHYAYHQYALTHHQCSSFVAQVASLADFYFDYEVSLSIQPSVFYRGYQIKLWEDPQYAVMIVASPDQIEKSLMEAVREGRAEYALDWYLNKS